MVKNVKSVANLLFEVGILSKTPRSGFYFLGAGQQSVAEHTNRTVYVGYALAQMEGGVDIGKVLQMCLFHDLVEGRTSDLNYIHQKYVSADEEKALKDLVDTLDFGKDIRDILMEYQKRESKEAVLAKDADNLEWILSLKEQVDTGSSRAKTWIKPALKRLKSQSAKRLAEEIMKTESDEWWFTDKEGEWWINRSKKALRKRI